MQEIHNVVCRMYFFSREITKNDAEYEIIAFYRRFDALSND